MEAALRSYGQAMYPGFQIFQKLSEIQIAGVACEV